MKHAGLDTMAASKRVVDAVFDTITSTMARGEEVSISGFGVFAVKKAAARQGRNPKTGQTITIAASIKPKFRAGKGLKDAVK